MRTIEKLIIPDHTLTCNEKGRFKLTFDRYPTRQDPWACPHIRENKSEKGSPLTAWEVLEVRKSMIVDNLCAMVKALNGESINYYHQHEERTYRTMKNGKVCKRPNIDTEFRMMEAAPDAAWFELRHNTADHIKAMSTAADPHSLERVRWLARTRLIRFMTENASQGGNPVTLYLNVVRLKNGLMDLKKRWENDEYTLRTKMINPTCLNEEVAQFFPPFLPLHLWNDHLPAFKFTVRGGFIEELECPHEYWLAMKYRLCYVDVQEVFAPAVVNGEPRQVQVEFINPPPQPLKRVSFFDRPDLDPVFPKVLTLADVLPDITPVLENLSYDPQLQRSDP